MLKASAGGLAVAKSVAAKFSPTIAHHKPQDLACVISESQQAAHPQSLLKTRLICSCYILQVDLGAQALSCLEDAL